MPIKSIRLYLVVILVSTICLVNFTAALNGYRNSVEASTKILDEQIASMSLMLVNLIDNEIKLPDNAFGDGVIFQLWRDNELIQSSIEVPNKTDLAPNKNKYQTINLVGYRWRTHSSFIEKSNLHVVYGQRFDLYTKLIDSMVLESILPIIWVLPILGILIWIIVSIGLKPIKLLTKTLEFRSVSDLSPITDDRFPKELEPLVNSTNSLFSRLDQAFKREQRFSADAAHELRTPLAALKINLHNHAKELNLPNDSLDQLKASALRMEHCINQLLSLYRLSPDNFQNSLENCDLRLLAQNTIVEFYNVLESKSQNIQLDAHDNFVIEGDAFALSIMLNNLISNASKYTPNNGNIHVGISTSKRNIVNLIIEDSGSGINEADLEFVFDRFYRIGGDQHPYDISGSGLGLSIVKLILELHSGNIKLSKSNQLGGLKVEIELPINQISYQNSHHEK